MAMCLQARVDPAPLPNDDYIQCQSEEVAFRPAGKDLDQSPYRGNAVRCQSPPSPKRICTQHSLAEAVSSPGYNAVHSYADNAVPYQLIPTMHNPASQARESCCQTGDRQCAAARTTSVVGRGCQKIFEMRLVAALSAMLFLMAAYLPVSQAEDDDYVYLILPLGNSITQAEVDRASYRYALWKRLVDAGISFDFVGSMNSRFARYTDEVLPLPDHKGKEFDRDHEGHFGWETDEIVKGRLGKDGTGSGNLWQWMKDYDFDMALIHLGTNDALRRQSSEQIAVELRQVISTLRSDNPSVVILLAKLIPTRWDDNGDGGVAAANRIIPDVAEEMNTDESPVLLVDQTIGFDAERDNYDGLHPNFRGEEKMAQRWFEAIMVALPLVKKRPGG